MTTTVAAIAMVLITAAQTPQQPAAPVGTGKVSGAVTRGDTNQPLENVTVRLIRWEGGGGQPFPAKRTEADGRFTFEGLSAGDYGVTFSAASFVTLDLGQTRPLDVARRISLRDGQHFDSADITLPRTGAIEGRLLDEFGDPAPGLTVQAARVQFVAGKRRLIMVSGAQGKPTDDLGQFRIFNLPPDAYYLVALSGPFAGPEDAAGFAVTYFPGSAVPTDATPVSVDVGQDVTGVAFQMAPAEMATVSGVATDETGTPAQAMIVLVPTSGGDVRAMIMSRIQSDPDGSFVFRNVPRGNYALQGFGRSVGSTSPASAPFGALQIAVDGDLRDLTVTVAPGATVRGRIILEGPAAPPVPSRVRVSPAPINFASGPVGGGPPESVTHSDWTFEVRNMTGIRVMTVTAGVAGWTLKKVMRDGHDITDQPIDFREGDVNGLEITLTSVVTSVTGTVTDGDKPATDCLVLVFAEDAAKWAFPSRYLFIARPNAQGSFTVTGLPAADYFLVAVPPRQSQDLQDPAALEQYRAAATRVIVMEGERKTAALRLVRPR